MKSIIISIIITVLLIGGAVFFSSRGDQEPIINPSATSTITTTTTAGIVTTSSNVSMENGIQVISLQVRGGYSPKQTVAKAGIPTVLRFITNNTFDCSRALRLSSLNISKTLPQTGKTDIDIGKPTVGLFRGTCGMGMYSFEIDFYK